MKNSTKLLYGLGFATVLGATTAFATVRSVDHRTADTPEASIPEATNGMWRLEATGVRIIGGYGDNFAYDGKNVRWLDGKPQIELDPSKFHFVAHTMQPDQNNFPPHTAWIHLHFSNVRVLEKPDGVQIPRQVDR